MFVQCHVWCGADIAGLLRSMLEYLQKLPRIRHKWLVFYLFLGEHCQPPLSVNHLMLISVEKRKVRPRNNLWWRTPFNKAGRPHGWLTKWSKSQSWKIQKLRRYFPYLLRLASTARLPMLNCFCKSLKILKVSNISKISKGLQESLSILKIFIKYDIDQKTLKTLWK